jgi:MFS family permease
VRAHRPQRPVVLCWPRLGSAPLATDGDAVICGYCRTPPIEHPAGLELNCPAPPHRAALCIVAGPRLGGTPTSSRGALHRRRAKITFLIVFSGWGMVLFYAPTILKEIGFADTTVSFAATLGLGVVFLAMTLISPTIIDRVGRKPLVVVGLLVMAGALSVMTALTKAPHASEVVRWGQVAILAVFVAVFALTLGLVGEIVVAELYPQEIRGPASSLSHGMRSVFASVFMLTFPLLLDVPGLTLTLLGYAVISVVGALYLVRALPETKGRRLEAIGDYWSDRALARTAAEVTSP